MLVTNMPKPMKREILNDKLLIFNNKLVAKLVYLSVTSNQ